MTAAEARCSPKRTTNDEGTAPVLQIEERKQHFQRNVSATLVPAVGLRSSFGENNDVSIRLSCPEDPRHVDARRRRADVLVRSVRRVEHQVRGSFYNLVVHEKGSTVRKHVNDSRLAGRLESALLVAVVDCRFDFVFALDFGSLLFRKQSRRKSAGASFRVKASRLAVPRRLPVHEAGKPVAAFTSLYVPGMFQY